MKNLFATAVSCCLLSLVAPCQQASHHQLIITELFADPTPSVALPSFEFMEWYNPGMDSIDLYKWKVSDGSTTGTVNTHFKLGPKSYVIVCSSAGLNAYSLFGNCVALSAFPSLNNDGDTVSIISPTNTAVFAVAYTDDWYRNDFKKEGGWTLEMIDLEKPCLGSKNWIASTFGTGGTPGKVNSVNGKINESKFIEITNAKAMNLRSITLDFNGSVDSSSFTQASISLNGFNGTVLKREVHPPLFQKATIYLNTNIDSNRIYSLTVSQLKDCYGANQKELKSKFGLAGEVTNGSLLINELLFDPPPEGADYVEFYHAGTRAINLRDVIISQRSASGVYSNSYPLTPDSYFLYPGELVVFSEKPDWVINHFPKNDATRIFKIAALPSLPDDKGWIAIRYLGGTTIDEFSYNKNLHYGLLNNVEGVALERISIKTATSQLFNWTSAAASVGFGSPGVQNSASTSDTSNPVEKRFMQVSPDYISPNNDGFNDRLSIRFVVTKPNWQVTIKLYDITGRFIRKIVEQYTLGIESELFYNGTDELNMPLKTGHYLLLAELLNTDGERRREKKLVSIVN